MITSILTSVKKMIGVDASYEHFDVDIITHINATLLTINQMGVGIEGVTLMIEDKNTDWTDFFEENEMLSAIKSFVFMKTRLAFDPPATSFALSALNEQIQELEWRILAYAEKDGVTYDDESED